MKWCFAHEHVSGNQAELADQLLPKQTKSSSRTQHFPSMPWRVIPAFLQEHVLEKKDGGVSLLEFIINTAVRFGEARDARWDEIDFSEKIWSIPASRMKAGKVHRVPLSNQMLKLLNKLKTDQSDGLIFRSKTRNTAFSDMTLTKFLREKKAPSDISGRHATVHGFRSSFRDWASEHGFSRDLAERALAHSIKDGVEAAYHRTDLLEQRRPMMAKWSQYLKKTQKKF